ncbi:MULTISPECIES: tetratricopeptide repeat protein [unclassified Streptomyces]|uniref:tetratricopeptide repeat protein n=1 Tax=unclassified Streptomyces TaxID=2593676 RepID=UPI000F4F6C06|nr:MULTISPECIES: tetratricopeptide repeat protein [unclassified Streptomyces]MDH6450415.1 tetratricopeptide (TPR) repeat protein [Streptomyces sp. SAI-119]MDH6499041.1 tetratricopeptide (TPR) repeat protein [Streptomyces sp. SAI-149]
MASSMVTSSQSPTPPRPNLAFRRLRGQRSPAEFAAAVRRAAREIGERVSCDARYVGRVEAGEIRCPNYAYERVFLHMFPGRTLTDLGFAPRSAVRGRRARGADETPGTHEPYDTQDTQDPDDTYDNYEESDVLRRAFMTGGGATVAAASLGPLGLAADATAAGLPVRRAGTGEAGALEEAVRRIRLLDDRHGADGLYRRAAAPLRAAYALLDAGATRQTTADRLHSGAGELAISVGWLAHDSGRFDDARSHYAEALATARVTGDDALEAHAFCNTAFLARDAGRPREAVRAAQAAQRVARPLGSPRLLSLLALREAGGWAGLADRTGCEQALARAQAFFERGLSDADPEWMSFYGEAELEGLEAQCWSTLGDWRRAARHARRAADLQDPHFTRNIALYTAELADDLARGGRPDEAAAAGLRVLELLGEVQSSRIQTMLAGTARVLLPHRRASGVSAFLERHASTPRTA